MTVPSNSDFRKVLAISSGKGGVGKTLLAACLSGIYNRQYNVLLIDMDLGVKGLTFMYGTADYWEEEHGSLMDYLGGKISAKEVILEAKRREGVALIPAATDFKSKIDWEEFLGNIESYKDLLLSLIEVAFKENFDFIIFDTRAGVDAFLLVLAELQPTIVIVVEADEISLTSAFDMRGQLKPETKEIRFLINKSPQPSIRSYDPILEKLKFLPPVPFDFKLYRRFIQDSRTLVQSNFKGTAFRRYVGRLAKEIFPVKRAPVPTFIDYLIANRATKFLINLFAYGFAFVIILIFAFYLLALSETIVTFG